MEDRIYDITYNQIVKEKYPGTFETLIKTKSNKQTNKNTLNKQNNKKSFKQTLRIRI